MDGTDAHDECSATSASVDPRQRAASTSSLARPSGPPARQPGAAGGRRLHQLDRLTERRPPPSSHAASKRASPRRLRTSARIGRDAHEIGRERHPDRHQTASAAPRRPAARSASPDAAARCAARLERRPPEPTIAELDEEGQRLLELRGGRFGIAQVGVDSGEAPEHLARTCGGRRPLAGWQDSLRPGPRVGDARPGGRVRARAKSPSAIPWESPRRRNEQGCPRRAAVPVRHLRW